MVDQSPLQLREGMNVVGSDGDKVGEVDRLEGDYVVVKKGMFFPTDYYIPTSAFTTADADQAYLNVTKDVALNQGWDVAPTERTTGYDTTGYDTTVSTDDVTRSGSNAVYNDDVAAQRVGTTAYDESNVRTGAETDTIRVPLSEEELTATRRQVDRGAVRVEKNVVSEEQSLDVPVTEEEVHVTRRTVDRNAAPGETLFEGGTIEVPVRGEEVDVEKRAHVAEELEISKEAVQKTQRVTDTVRREEAHVVDDSTTTMDDDLTTTDANDRTRRGNDPKRI